MPARTFPPQLPAHTLRDTKRSAEIDVYNALRDQLSSQYSVFYSRPWTGTNPDGTEKEGEADFVVAHPDTGFLVLEIKGGRVRRDGESGKWWSVDRFDTTHAIHDPYGQARRSKHAILERLKDTPTCRGRRIGAGIGVVFPDCTDIAHVNVIDVSNDQTACAEDLPRLGSWVINQLKRTVGTHDGPLGTDGLAALTRLISGGFTLRVPLVRPLDADARDLDLTATEQQSAILELLSRHRKLAVAGTAGSGKTIIARHKTLELAESGEKLRILLTCFNRPLAAYLRNGLEGRGGVVVGAFHEVCLALCGAAGVVPGGHEADRDYFNSILPGALLEAVDRRKDLRFDAIIVDEGQDFRDDWLETLQLCLKDPAGIFWVFYDDNQRIYDAPGVALAGLVEAPVVLRKNVRNTQQIFSRLQPLLGGEHIAPLGPPGRPVEEILVASTESLRPKVLATINHLLHEEQMRPEDIAILMGTKDRLESIFPDRKIPGQGTVEAGPPVPGRLCLDTVRRFKGLERKVVILVEPTDFRSPLELLYVAISRAMTLLIMIGTRIPIIAIDHDP